MREDHRAFLEEFLQTRPGPLQIVFRDDDITTLNEPLRRMLVLFLEYRAPVHLAVIPAKVEPAVAVALRVLKSKNPGLLEFGQHGFAHKNYGTPPLLAEFGVMRSYEEQSRDMAAGKAIMETLFAGDFSPVFTPPFHEYDAATLRCVDELGFRVFSKGYERPYPRELYRFREISMNLDPVESYFPYIAYKPESQLIAELIGKAQKDQYLGLLLHHDFLTEPQFSFLEFFLKTLRSCPDVAVLTMIQLAGAEKNYGET